MNLFYETLGTGEPLILIPGFASGAWTWFKQSEDLSKDFQIITFDPRGIGRSKTSDEDLQNLSIEVFVKDILQILDELKVEKANVLGASFGGFVAQEFALSFPERLNKLILACTSYGGAKHVKPDIEILRSFTPDPALTHTEQIRKFLRPAFTEEFNQNCSDMVEKVCRLREENEVAEAVYTAQLETAFTFNFEDRVSKISAETLIITGDKDSVVPMGNSLNLADKIPNAKLKIIKNGSHLFFIENAEEFNRAVKEFLSEPPAVAGGLT
ncbi:MAG: alpha/beta hydrolase [Pyrinomonadaceae bacterium]|nr:alpha/beta hydrolase [Pyrinomonadaceae bacterium]